MLTLEEAGQAYLRHLAEIGAMDAADTRPAPTPAEALQYLRQLAETATDDRLFGIVAAVLAAQEETAGCSRR